MKTLPIWHFHPHFDLLSALVPTVFPKAIMPTSDHRNVFHEEPRILECVPSVLVFGWLAALYVCVGILSQANLAILEPLTRTCAYADTACIVGSNCHPW